MDGKTHNPTVTITVQGYRNPQMLRLCLNSIQKYADLGVHDVIVADGETQQETHMMMREEFPHFHFLPQEKNIGFGALVNACLKHAKGKYIFVMNPDTILEEKTLGDLTKFMNERKDVGICGPMQKNFNGKIENTRFAFYKPQTILYRRTFLRHLPFAKKHLAHFEMREVRDKNPYPVAWIMGSAMFARREMIEMVGGMDTRYFMYMEDVDWCRRFWEKGFKVYYHPQITLFHFYGKGSARGTFLQNILFNRLTRVHIVSAYKYFTKYAFRTTPQITP